MTNKFYVIDTNIMLLDPDFYESYKDGIIVIPKVVVDELDTKKNGFGTLAINSRLATKLCGKIVDQMLVKKDYYEVNGAKFMFKHYMFDNHLTNDEKIISTALELKRELEDAEVMLVSNDNNVRVLCQLGYHAHGVKAIRHNEENQVNVKDYYNVVELKLLDRQVGDLYNHNLHTKTLGMEEVANVPVNIVCENGDIIEARTSMNGKKLVPYNYVAKKKKKGNGIVPLNSEQVHLQKAIQDGNLKVVSCFGRTGSGKSLIAIATALELLGDQYSTIHCIKPYQPVGNSVGMLKGTLEDKIKPIKASFECVLDMCGKDMERLEQFGQLTFSTPEFVRGITYHNTLMIVDEVQNLTPHEVKTIITRAGEGSKVILLGDTRQVDNSYLTENSNGLAVVTDALIGQSFFCNVFLKKSERADFLNIVDDLI